MAIIETLDGTGNYFWHWLQGSDTYKNNFSYEGANAVQDYMRQLSEETGEDMEFDPIAWCCEFSEYEDLKELQTSYPDIKKIDDLRDETQVISENPLVIADY